MTLEHRLDVWKQKASNHPVLPTDAVAALEKVFGTEGDGPLIRRFIQDTVSPARIRGRLDSAEFHMTVGDLDAAAAGLDRLDRDIEAVKNMIANAVPVVNAISAPHYARGKSNVVQLKENTGQVNKERHDTRAREWKKWNEVAAEVWAVNPRLSKSAVATIVKSRLDPTDEVDTISRRLKKPRTAH
jgi:hypothetical protein